MKKSKFGGDIICLGEMEQDPLEAGGEEAEDAVWVAAADEVWVPAEEGLDPVDTVSAQNAAPVSRINRESPAWRPNALTAVALWSVKHNLREGEDDCVGCQRQRGNRKNDRGGVACTGSPGCNFARR